MLLPSLLAGSMGKRGGASEGCSRRRLGDLPWRSDMGRGHLYLHSGSGDRTNPGVNPCLDSGTPSSGGWSPAEGPLTQASLAQPHSFHGNQNPLAGAEPHPRPNSLPLLGREHALVIGKQVKGCDYHSLAWPDVTRL